MPIRWRLSRSYQAAVGLLRTLLPSALICAAFAGPLAAPAHARVVWGDVHAHSGFSLDGKGDPNDFYIKARDEVHLDFVVLSDHDIWISQSEWTTLMDLADFFNEPGRFVTFVGVEWTHDYHMNVYFRG